MFATTLVYISNGSGRGTIYCKSVSFCWWFQVATSSAISSVRFSFWILIKAPCVYLMSGKPCISTDSSSTKFSEEPKGIFIGPKLGNCSSFIGSDSIQIHQSQVSEIQCGNEKGVGCKNIVDHDFDSGFGKRAWEILVDKKWKAFETRPD